jgi:hypothetical protein
VTLRSAALGLVRLDRRIVTAFLVSRVVILLAAVLAENVLTRNAALTSGDGAPILRSLTAWDGWWYLGIARDGYHAAPVAGGYHDYAFFPLYPALVAALSWPWPALAGLVSVVLSNVLALLGLGLLSRLGEPYLGAERASRAAALLAIAPFSAVFAMAYAESLFLVLSVGAFLAMERGHRATAGVLIGLASLARLQGVVLVLPLVLLGWWRDGRRWRPPLLWLALGPLAAAAFFGYVAWLTGSAGAYGDAQAIWGRGGLAGDPAGGSLGSRLSLANLVSLVTLLVAVFLLVFIRRDFRRYAIPWPYALVPVLFLGAVFASGILESVGRYALLAFPFAWILACRPAGFQRWWPAVSVGLLFATSAAWFGGWLVP